MPSSILKKVPVDVHGRSLLILNEEPLSREYFSRSAERGGCWGGRWHEKFLDAAALLAVSSSTVVGRWRQVEPWPLTRPPDGPGRFHQRPRGGTKLSTTLQSNIHRVRRQEQVANFRTPNFCLWMAEPLSGVHPLEEHPESTLYRRKQRVEK